MIKKQNRKIKTSKKTKNTHKSILTKQQPNEAKYLDIEEYLLSEILEKNTNNSTVKLPLQTTIFLTTTSMRKLAYKHGYSIGRSLYVNYGESDKLLSFIESGGIGNLFYYPYGEFTIIKSKVQKIDQNCNTNVHFYEAGVMAGYLSGFLDKDINVIETTCVNNGAESCQFNASYSILEPTFSGIKKIQLQNLIKLAIQNTNKENINNPYQILSLFPILNSKELTKILSKLLFISGYTLSENSNVNNLKESLDKLSRYIGTNILYQKTGNKKKSLKINITYNNLNSILEYVSLTSNLFVGLITGVTKKEVKTNITINKDNTYILKIFT